MPSLPRLIVTLAQWCLLALVATGPMAGLTQAQQPQNDRHNHISAKAWLSDPTNSLGPEQVSAMAWAPYVGPLRNGYSTGTTWIKLKIEPRADDALRGAQQDPRMVLRIQPGHLDEIALFDPRQSRESPQLAGDQHDWRLSSYRSFNQNLVIAAPAEPIEVFLRLRTQTHHGINVEALYWDDAMARDRQQQLVIGAVITFLLMVLAWAVAAWVEKPERVIGAFVVHQLISVVFALSLLGFFRVYLSDWLPPASISHLSSAMFTVTTTAVLWFHWHFLREFRPPALGMRALQWLIVLTPLTLLMMLAGWMAQALRVITLLCAFYPALLLLMVCFVPKSEPHDPTKLSRLRLILIYSAMCLILASATFPALGWLPSPPWAMYSAIGYGLVSAAMLFAALRQRFILAMNESRAQKTKLLLAEQLLEHERDKRREQDQFMTMLTHELTNALATAHLAIGSLPSPSPMRARGYRAIESMRDIIRRCSQSGEFEANDSAPVLAVEKVSALLQELCRQLPDDAAIVLNTQADLPDCLTDRKLLGIVLFNLLDNAIKYRATDSAIEVAVSLQPEGERVGLQVSVSNMAGPAGWPDAERVFKKYWRGAAATRWAGSGLGLYLSGLIAKRLGGDLRYRPDETHVRFELWLPI